MRLEDGSLVTEIGPFDREALRRELADERAGDLGLRRILDTVMDAVETRDERRRRLDHPPQAARRLMLRQQSDRELLREYHERGNVAAREELIERNLSLVRSLARRYAYRGEQFDDLVQIGTIGLIKAIDRFDVDRGVELTTFATPNVIGEIKRHFRDKGWAVRVPRGLQELNVRLSKLVEQLTVELGRSPSIPELATAAEVDPEQVLEALESARAYTSVSLSAGGEGDDEGEFDPLESIGEEEPQYEIAEDWVSVTPGLRTLDNREKAILRLRFFDGLTQSQIAKQIGISQMHVSRLIRRALQKVRAEIEAQEGSLDPE